MNAALRLSWYKFKHHYMDFIKVLLGIVAFEGLILYIQDKGFLKDFETTRMTLFLLLFSTSLLIVVQNSIYISKERSVLNRDFFSGLSRSAFALASMGIHAFFAVLETIVFILSYSVFSKFFDKEFPDAGHIFGSYRWEVGITVLLFLGVAFYCPLYLSLGWQIWDYLCYPSSCCGDHAIFIVRNYPIFAKSDWLGTKIYLSRLWAQAFWDF